MVRFIQNNYKLLTEETIPFKKSLLRNRKKQISLIQLDLGTSVFIPIFIHYGPICVKKNALFFPNVVIIRGKYYTLNNAKFNDSLFEINLLSKKILRIQFFDSYNTIKNLYKSQ